MSPRQLNFDWLLPEGPMLKVAAIAAATGMQTTFVEEHFAEKCHRYAGDSRKRPPMRIPRAFVVALLVESAKYTAGDKVEAVASCFREFDAAELLELRAAIDTRLRKLAGPKSA